MDEDDHSVICRSCGHLREPENKNIHPLVRTYTSYKIDSENRFLELNGALYTKPIETRIRTIGTSLGFIMPKALMEYFELEHGDAVKLIIMPDRERDKRGN